MVPTAVILASSGSQSESISGPITGASESDYVFSHVPQGVLRMSINFEVTLSFSVWDSASPIKLPQPLTTLLILAFSVRASQIPHAFLILDLSNSRAFCLPLA